MNKILLLIVLSNVGFAAPEKLLQSSQSWDGGEINYPEGQAEITSLKLKLLKGHSTKFHCHPVPTFGYIVKGDLQVETLNGNKTLMKKGESILEVMKTIHKGTAIDSEVEIVVFYAGAKDIPNTVLMDSELAEKYCK